MLLLLSLANDGSGNNLEGSSRGLSKVSMVALAWWGRRKQDLTIATFGSRFKLGTSRIQVLGALWLHQTL